MAITPSPTKHQAPSKVDPSQPGRPAARAKHSSVVGLSHETMKARSMSYRCQPYPASQEPGARSLFGFFWPRMRFGRGCGVTIHTWRGLTLYKSYPRTLPYL